MPEIKKIRKNGTDYTLADETARAAAQDAREMAGYQADLVRMEMAAGLAGKADVGDSYTKAESDAALEQVRESAASAQTAAEQARVDVAAEANARTIADAKINRKVDMLYKISEGVLWDIEQREESGAAQLPKGGEFGNIDEVRGRTEQGENPTPDNPQEIVSIDSFTVRHADADGSMLDERTITPPRPLNAIGEYKDAADVVNGEWIYKNGLAEIRRWEVSSNTPYGYLRETKFVNNGDFKSNQFERSSWENHIYDGGVSLVKYRGDGAQAVVEILKNNHQSLVIYAQLRVPETLPVNPDDLEWLRSLTLEECENLFVTDNHGRDVSYLMSDFINLKKAVEQ